MSTTAQTQETKDPEVKMQAATNAPPPPPIEDSSKVVKIPTELEKIENNPSPEEIRKEFNYAKGKIHFPPSAWNEITDITSSAEGAGGVFFVNVPQSGGTVVVKGSPDIVKEVFASRLAAMVGVLAPDVRVLDYRNPTNEWKIMKTQIKEFTTKENRDADLTKAQKVLKRAFLIVMEVFLGTDLEKIRRQAAQDLFIMDESKSPKQIKNTKRLLRQLGKLVAFDMLCNNWDRLPVIWDNEGNLRNIRVEHIGVDEPNIVALDNTITCIIPDNFNTYEEKLRDCLAALTTDVNAEYKGYKTVREVLSFTSSVDFTEREIREMQIGTLEGIIEIAKLTPETLTKMKEEFSKMVVQDWENVWASGVESINIDFLTSVINIMQEYVPAAQKTLAQYCK